MDTLDAQAVGDAFPGDAAAGAVAQLGPIFDSNGGYYNVQTNPVYAQYAYGTYGNYFWTPPVPIPVGPAILQPGTVAVRFRNYTAGSVATVSGALSEKGEPAVQITSGGVASSSGVRVNGITGSVSSAGAIVAGTGFSVAHPSTGLYQITLSPALSATPIVTALAFIGSGAGYCIMKSVSAVLIEIETVNGAGTLTDEAFHFVALIPQ